MTTRRAGEGGSESWWARAWPRVRLVLWAVLALILVGQLASCVPYYRRRAYGYGYYGPTYYDTYGYPYGSGYPYTTGYPYRSGYPYYYDYAPTYAPSYVPAYRDQVYVTPPAPSIPPTRSGVIVDPPGVRSTPSGPVSVPPRGPVIVTPPR